MTSEMEGAYYAIRDRKIKQREKFERELLEEAEYDKYEYVIQEYEQRYEKLFNFNDPELDQKLLNLASEFSNTHWVSIREKKYLPALDYALQKYFSDRYYNEVHVRGQEEEWWPRVDYTQFDYDESRLGRFSADQKRLCIRELTNGEIIFKHLVLRQYVNDYFDTIRRKKVEKLTSEYRGKVYDKYLDRLSNYYVLNVLTLGVFGFIAKKPKEIPPEIRLRMIPEELRGLVFNKSYDLNYDIENEKLI